MTQVLLDRITDDHVIGKISEWFSPYDAVNFALTSKRYWVILKRLGILQRCKTFYEEYLQGPFGLSYEGHASYHFTSKSRSVVSFVGLLQARPLLPMVRLFLNVQYDRMTRTLTANIDWGEGKTVFGARIWRYCMHFTSDFTRIDSGYVDRVSIDEGDHHQETLIGRWVYGTDLFYRVRYLAPYTNPFRVQYRPYLMRMNEEDDD